jgi:hypothetical protein
MNQKIFIALSLIVFLFISCKKENTPPPPEINFAAEGLAYVQLPLNKYFIYKDSATGMQDSVVVTESKLERNFNSQYSVPFYQQVFTITLTKNNGATQNDWFYAIAKAENFGIFSAASTNSASLALRERDRINNTDKNYA